MREKLESIAKEKREKESQQFKGADPTDLELGDIVYRKKHFLEMVHKMDYKHDGPYRIVEKRLNGSYLIQNLNKGEKIVNRRYLIKSSGVVFYFEEGEM